MVTELFQVALDMGWCQRRRTTGEDGVHIIPRQTCTVIATGHRCLVVVVGEHRWHTRQHPCFGVTHIEEVLGVLEVIDIGGVVLCAVGLASYELGKLTCQSDLRGLGHMQQGQLVQHIRQPLRLLFPVQVQSPDGVV